MRKLNKAIFTIGGLTMLSRVVGLFRDLLIASVLGAGPVADAFFVALKTPNLFRRFSAEGAFSAAFVPVFSSLLTKDKKKAEDFSNKVLAMMVSFLVPFCGLMILIMPWFIYLIAPGFIGDSARFDIAVNLSRITFPFLLFTSLVAMIGGMLNSVGKYAPFAGAPIIFNICLIVSLLLPNMFSSISYQMAMAITISGLLQLILMLFALRRTELKVKLSKPKVDKQEKKFLKLMGNGIIGSGIVQINIFVGTLLASLLPAGAISYLYYADRLNQLPVGVIGVAIGTATLPMLSKAIANNNKKEKVELFNKSIVIGLFFSIFSAVAFFVMSEPLIDIIFNRGKFTDADVIACSNILKAYVVGLPAYILIKILSNVFFASHDTKTPMITSSLSALYNIIFAIILLKPFGYVGIAAASAISSWINVFMLYSKQNIEILPSTKKKIADLIMIAIAMGAILRFGSELLSEFLDSSCSLTQFIFLAIILFIGGSFVILLSFIQGIWDIKSFLKFFKKTN
ncbi:MAG: murein biosynthesis integral membrane protein MurJ [Alphaproteobacteria bacterium]|nr:murein biosynthesis integral membrane protein MurJ [Alphaproteobacteria bacterium]